MQTWAKPIGVYVSGRYCYPEVLNQINRYFDTQNQAGMGSWKPYKVNFGYRLDLFLARFLLATAT